MNICTIVATNYLAHARVLAESFAAHHPDGTCHVLLVDDVDHTVDGAAESFTVVRPGELDLDARDFDEMASAYNVLELSTALKPWMLQHMLDTVDDGSGVAYLDPDILVASRLVELEAALAEHAIVLTPHLTEPLPRDGLRPAETDILLAGIYNLGFIGLARAPEADALLAWWRERLRHDCRIAHVSGLFLDQRWIDFVPGLFARVHVLRQPTYNVAYWNLPARTLAGTPDAITVDGSPLRFFHFSGYSPDAPRALSKFQNRVPIAVDPVLRDVCDAYRARLLAAGVAATSARPYGYGALPGGLVLDDTMRELYRVWHAAAAPTASIFTDDGARAFRDHLQEPVRPGALVGRYLYEVWLSRAFFQEMCPDVLGADAEGWLWWCEHHGGEQASIPEQLRPAGRPLATPVPEAPRAEEAADVPAPADPVAPPRPFGANVIGYLRAELGVGEVARQLVGALDAAGVPTMPIALETEHSRQSHDYDAVSAPGPFAVNVACVNADVFPALARDAGLELHTGRYTVGVWAWELDTFPERFAPAFAHVDEIWAGSRFIADALAAVAPVPVVTMPYPVDVPPTAPFVPGELGWPDAFTVLLSWDYNSVFARKNPLGAIEAYCRAFGPDDGAALVLKCINHERDAAHHELIRAEAAARPDIVLLDEYVAPGDKDRLMASADCYLSLHRSEGFGMTMAEAMAHGTPVVATGYSGSNDFLTAATGFPVGYALAPVGPGAEPYGADGRWAEPDVADAARLLRHVFEDRAGAARVAAHGRDEIVRRHGALAAGRAVERRLREIERARADPSPGGVRALGQRARARLSRQKPRPETPLPAAWTREMAHAETLRAERARVRRPDGPPRSA